MGSKNAGFTLLELIITVSIAAILASVAIPSLVNTIRNNRLATQTNEIIRTLIYARSEAVKRNVRVVVCRSTDINTVNPAATPAPTCATGGTTGWETGWLVFNDPDGDSVFDPPASYPSCGTGDECLLATHTALTGSVSLTGNNNVANRVTFNSIGLATASNGALVLKYTDDTGNTNTRVICVATSGRARLMPKGTAVASCTASD